MAESTGLWGSRCGGITGRDRANLRRYLATLFAWAVAYVASTWVVQSGRVAEGLAAWLVVAFPSLVAVLAVRAYIRYLVQADEMQRTIELQALALAVGAGFITWPAMNMIAKLGVPVESWDVPVLMMIATYAVASVLGRIRYR